jgi:hypothetical protein
METTRRTEITIRNHSFVLSPVAVAIVLNHDKTVAEASALTGVPANVLEAKLDGVIRVANHANVTFREMADAIRATK